METDIKPTSAEAFLSVACAKALVSSDQAIAAAKEAAHRGVGITQVLVDQGILDNVQVDAVEILLRPGDAIPGYEIVDLLGKGGMGAVYSARQKTLDRLVAIKTILLSKLTQEGMVSRFEKEALTVARLRHPNIVTAFDFGRHEGRLYLVMELLDGEDLEMRIFRDGKLDEATAWGLARQVVGGLSHAAAHGMVHRDIKPGNLFLVQPPEGFSLPSGLPLVKITDFGLVLQGSETAAAARLTMAGAALGTPVYMAPEQVANKEVDFRADIYALGATVFHMMTGQEPFLGKSIWHIVTQKMDGAAPRVDLLRECVSPQSAALILAMMAHNPDSRIGSYPELRERIDEILGQSAGTSLAESAVKPVSRSHLTPSPQALATSAFEAPESFFRKRPWLLIGAGIFGAAVCLLGGLAWWLNGPTTTPLTALISASQPESLFNGASLGFPDWTTLEGRWKITQDAEGSKVISGKNGVIQRRLAKRPAYYRLSVGVDPSQAKAVELHFAIAQAAGRDQPRYVLRVSKDGVCLAQRSGDHEKFEVLSQPLPFLKSSSAENDSPYRELRVERQATRWLALFEGKEVGSAPTRDRAELPEFRLVVDEGIALFGSLEIAELVRW